MTDYEKPRASWLQLLDPEQRVDSFQLDHEIEKLMDKRNTRHRSKEISRLFDVPMQPPHIRKSIIARSLQGIHSSTPLPRKNMPPRFTNEISSISSDNGLECEEVNNRPSKGLKISMGEVIVIDSSASQSKSNQQEASVSRGQCNMLPPSSNCAPGESGDSGLNSSDQENACSRHNSNSKIANEIGRNTSKTEKSAVDFPKPPPRTKKKLKILQQQENEKTETLTVPRTGSEMVGGLQQLDGRRSRSISKKEVEDLQRLSICLKRLVEGDPSKSEDNSVRRSRKSLYRKSESEIEGKDNEKSGVTKGADKRNSKTRKSMPRNKSDDRPGVESGAEAHDKSINISERDREVKKDLEQEPRRVTRNGYITPRNKKEISRIHLTSDNAKQCGTDSRSDRVLENESGANKDVEDGVRSATTEKNVSNRREGSVVNEEVVVSLKTGNGDHGTSRCLGNGMENREIDEIREKSCERIMHSSSKLPDSQDVLEKDRPVVDSTKENERPQKHDPQERNEDLGQELPGNVVATPKSTSIMSRDTPRIRKSVTFVDALNYSSNNLERLPPPPVAVEKSPTLAVAAPEERSNISEGSEDVEPKRIEVHENVVLSPAFKEDQIPESRRRDVEPGTQTERTKVPSRDCQSNREENHRKPSEESDADPDPAWRRKTRKHRIENNHDSLEDARTATRNKVAKYDKLDSCESEVEDHRRRHEREKEKRYLSKARYASESESSIFSEREAANRLPKNNVLCKAKRRRYQRYESDDDSDSELEYRGRKTTARSEKTVPRREKRNRRLKNHVRNQRWDSDVDDEKYREAMLVIKHIRERKTGPSKYKRIVDKTGERRRRQRDRDQSDSSVSVSEVEHLLKEQRGRKCRKDAIYDDDRLLIRRRDTSSCTEDEDVRPKQLPAKVRQQKQAEGHVVVATPTLPHPNRNANVDAATARPNLAAKVDAATSPPNLVEAKVDAGTSPPNLEAKADAATSPPNLQLSVDVAASLPILEASVEAVASLLNSEANMRSPEVTTTSRENDGDLSRGCANQEDLAVELENLFARTSSQLANAKRDRLHRRFPKLFETVAMESTRDQLRFSTSSDDLLMDMDLTEVNVPRKSGRWRVDDGLASTWDDASAISIKKTINSILLRCQEETAHGDDASDALRRDWTLQPSDSDESYTFAEAASKKISLTPFEPPRKKTMKIGKTKVYQKKKLFIGTKKRASSSASKDPQLPKTARPDSPLKNRPSTLKKRTSSRNLRSATPPPLTSQKDHEAAEEPRMHKRLEETPQNQSPQREDDAQEPGQPSSITKSARNAVSPGQEQLKNSFKGGNTRESRSASRRNKTAVSNLVDGGTQTSSKRFSGRRTNGGETNPRIECSQSPPLPPVNPVVAVEEVELTDEGQQQKEQHQQHLPIPRRLDFVSDDQSGDRGRSRGLPNSPLAVPLPPIQEYEDNDSQTQVSQPLQQVENPPENNTISTKRKGRKKERLTAVQPKARNSKRSVSVTQDSFMSTNAMNDTVVRRSGRERRPPNPGMYRCVILVNNRNQVKSFNTELTHIDSENDVTSALSRLNGTSRMHSTGVRRASSAVADRTSQKRSRTTPPKNKRRTNRKEAADSTVTDEGAKKSKRTKKGEETLKKVSMDKHPLSPPSLQDNDCDGSAKRTKRAKKGEKTLKVTSVEHDSLPPSSQDNDSDEGATDTRRANEGKKTLNKEPEVASVEKDSLRPASQDDDSGMVDNGTMSVTSSSVVWAQPEPCTSKRFKKTRKTARTTVSSSSRFSLRSRSRTNDDSNAIAQNVDVTDSAGTDVVCEKMSSMSFEPPKNLNKDLQTDYDELLDLTLITVVPGGEKPPNRVKSNFGFMVRDGNALVRIGNSYQDYNRNQTFKVPKGEMYMIKNLSDEEPLKLICRRLED